MSSQPPGLLARIRRMRLSARPWDEVATPSRGGLTGAPRGGLTGAPAGQPADWEARIAHLEQLVQGLQDSVYREGQRQEKRITELEKRLEPTSLAAALSKDARDRGL
jgi:hypothetical protein